MSSTTSTTASASVKHRLHSGVLDRLGGYHTLPMKLRAIASAGFKHVELVFSDLESYAAQRHEGYQKLDSAGQGELGTLLKTAEQMKTMCSDLGMAVVVVHVFSQFEGHTDPVKRAESFSRAKAWFAVLNALGCTMLQVGSSDDSSSSGDLDVIIRDLRELADLAAAQNSPIKIAYEMWAWGVHVNIWEHTWEICKRVDRDNFARAYVYPSNPPNTLSNANQNLHESLNNLTRTIPQHKIFYFQISDCFRSASASTLHKQAGQEKEEGDAGAHPLYSWRNARRPLPWMDTLPSTVKAREERKTEGREEGEIKEEGFGG